MGPKQNKPKPKNDYYFFMEEQKKVLQAQGIKYRGMKELADLCGPKWRQLGEAERSR